VADLIHLPTTIRSLADFQNGFAVQHTLAELELLNPAGVQDLADRLPPGSAEPGRSGLVAEGGLGYIRGPMTDAGPAVRALPGKNASVYLYNVEQDPEYGHLIRRILGEVSHKLGMAESDIKTHEGYVFLTGGAATTSVHVDHEYNFLLVVRGHKRVFIADVPSEEGERALESMHSGGYGTCDSIPTSGTMFEIGSGEGVFIPPRAAHYVENGPGPCAALSVVFSTAELEAEAKMYRTNALLRRVGFDPKSPGVSPKFDQGKRLFADVAMTIRRAGRAITNLRTAN
jgi:hypothetical protein